MPNDRPQPVIDIPAGVVHEVETYRRVDGHALRMLVYRGRESGNERRPAIMWFHGGGWRKGNPEQFYRFCLAGVDAGMVAVAPQYRLVGQEAGTAWDSMDDAWGAYLWLVEHADTLGVDRERLVMAGSSAGGHLAATIATHHPEAEVAALVLLNPVVDCTERGYLLAERGEEASPVYRVRPGLPPTLVVHGDADKTVAYENSVRFERVMREAGNDCTLVTMPGEDHGLWNRLTGRMIAETYGFLRQRGLASPDRAAQGAS